MVSVIFDDIHISRHLVQPVDILGDDRGEQAGFFKNTQCLVRRRGLGPKDQVPHLPQHEPDLFRGPQKSPYVRIFHGIIFFPETLPSTKRRDAGSPRKYPRP